MTDEQATELIEVIKTLTGSIDKLQAEVSSSNARLTDILNTDNHDMLRELNGSIQELIQSLDRKK
jgi:hypothetical protein